MQIKNIQVFSSKNAQNGNWIDISNLVAFSIELENLEGNVWIEVSNDPNVNIDNTNTPQTPPAAPVLSQFAYQPSSGNSFLTYNGVTATWSVRTTYITPWGETSGSTAASLTVTPGNVLFVAPPTGPTGSAVGWNVYVGPTGAEVLQSAPAFYPQHVTDTGGIVTQTNGVLPFGPSFNMVSWNSSGVTVPSQNNSGTVNYGINVTGNLAGSPTINDEFCIIQGQRGGTGATGAVVNPSCLVWKWLRVCKSNTAQNLITTAWLLGQNG